MYDLIRSRLQVREPVLLDGALGTELVRRGVRWRKHGLLTDAPAVERLHGEYLAAGADVLRTNTFQLNPRIYLNVFRNREHMRHIGAPELEGLTPRLLRTSVQVARQARAKAGADGCAVIAGVLSPLEHCFRPDLAPSADKARLEQEALARVFAEEKVDFLLLESMNTIGEAAAALAAGRAAGLPVWRGAGELRPARTHHPSAREARAMLLASVWRFRPRGTFLAAELEIRVLPAVHRNRPMASGALPGRSQTLARAGCNDPGRLLRHASCTHCGAASVARRRHKERAGMSSKGMYQPVAEKLARRETVVLDGAIGTEILRRNVTWADHQLASRPEFVRGIHEDYIRAGADVISTNSFQLCRRALYNHFRDAAHRRQIGATDLDERANRLLAQSVRLAIEARERAAAGRPVAVAAAVTTLEWCFRPDLAPSAEQARDEYREILEVVKEAGADLVLLETVNSITEARVALEVAKSLGMACWVAFVPDERGRLFTGEEFQHAAATLEPRGVDAILLNCAPPEDITAGMAQLAPHAHVPIGAYAHIGRFDPPEWLFTDEYPPAKYRDAAARWKQMGSRILGGCCGTTPEHIAALGELR